MSGILALKDCIKSLSKEIREKKTATRIAQKAGKHAEASALQSVLPYYRRNARFNLIAYGLMRGMEYDRIEKPRKPLTENEWTDIKVVQNVYSDVPACAA